MPEICFTTKVWRSGAAWVSQNTVQAIAEEGATIAFVAPLAQPESREPRNQRLTRYLTPRELVGRGSRLERAKASLSRIAAGTWRVLRLRGSTRIFIFSIPEPLLFTLPLFALLRLSGARVILVVHDAEPHAWAFPKSLQGVERAAHKLSYRLASGLVSLTDSVKSALVEDFGIAADKIAVIPHGAFSLGTPSPMPGNRRLLIFGSLRRNKCVLEAIHGVVLARQRGEDISLVLAGAPLKQEPGYWAQCEAAISRDPAGFDVRLGFLPDEDLPGVIAGVDAFLLAYKDFNSQSGVAVLAALAGRPVIGTRSGGLDELYRRGMAGELVEEPVTPETIADGISRFLSIPLETWQAKASAAVDAVGAGLDWNAIGKDYIRFARGEAMTRQPRAAIGPT